MEMNQAMEKEGKGVENAASNNTMITDDNNNDEELSEAMDAWELNKQEFLLTHAKKYLAMMRRQERDIHCQETLIKEYIQQLPGKLEVLHKNAYNLRADEQLQAQLIQIIEAEVQRLRDKKHTNNDSAIQESSTTAVITPVKGKESNKKQRKAKK